MIAAPREYLRADERRSRLLRSAWALVLERGPDALTMRAVAAEAGVAHGVVHYVFGTKEALVRDLLREQMVSTVSGLLQGFEEDRSQSDGDPLVSRIESGLARWTCALMDNPVRFEAMLRLSALVEVPEADPETRRELNASIADVITENLEGWSLTSGRRPIPSSREVAEAVIAITTGITRWWLTTRDVAGLKRMTALLAGAFHSEPVTD